MKICGNRHDKSLDDQGSCAVIDAFQMYKWMLISSRFYFIFLMWLFIDDNCFVVTQFPVLWIKVWISFDSSGIFNFNDHLLVYKREGKKQFPWEKKMDLTNLLKLFQASPNLFSNSTSDGLGNFSNHSTFCCCLRVYLFASITHK